MHTLFVTCFDSGNLDISSDEQTFNLLRDNQAPQIVRAYRDGETVLIATNELTACQYSIKQFTYGQGSDMDTMGEYSKVHRYSWIPDKIFFVKCKDRFGNEMSSSMRTTKSEESVVF